MLSVTAGGSDEAKGDITVSRDVDVIVTPVVESMPGQTQ